MTRIALALLLAAGAARRVHADVQDDMLAVLESISLQAGAINSTLNTYGTIQFPAVMTDIDDIRIESLAQGVTLDDMADLLTDLRDNEDPEGAPPSAFQRIRDMYPYLLSVDSRLNQLNVRDADWYPENVGLLQGVIDAIEAIPPGSGGTGIYDFAMLNVQQTISGTANRISNDTGDILDLLGGPLAPIPQTLPDSELNGVGLDDPVVGDYSPDEVTDPQYLPEIAGEVVDQNPLSGFAFPSLSPAEGEETPPVWTLTIPLSIMEYAALSDTDIVVDWEFWIPFRPIVSVVMIALCAVWAALMIFGELRRYG